MDSSEEISDNILSYLLENIRDSDSSMVIEGENVSTATDNDINNVSELDNSLNQLTSTSLKSAFSSKKLEWDSSADVGCLPDRATQFKSKLSTLEKMALSNSASKLCLDEDEQSLALIAKIDRVLAKSKVSSKTYPKTSKKSFKIPTWPSIDSCSNASADTVIPLIPELKAVRQPSVPFEKQSEKVADHNAELPVPKINHSESRIHKRSHASHLAKPKLQRSKGSSQYEECESELFVTRSAAIPEFGLYASNNLHDTPIPVTPTNFVNSAREQVSSQCPCVSDDASETTCPTHTSLSSEHTRRMRREAMGELQVYRGLKEHLKNLKEYVSQLEQTWKFLDQTSSAVPSRPKESDVSRHSRPKTRHSVERLPQPTREEFPSPSRSSQISEDFSTPINSVESIKSDRSFELERLNLHDTDSTTEDSRPLRKSKSKCCNHCSLKKKSETTGHHRRAKDEKAVQTSDSRLRVASSVDNVVPQREPIAYDISIEACSKPQERPRSKTTLQEALKEKRPDFYNHSEHRRKAIQEISHLRRMGMLDSNFTPHLFSYYELRKHTEEMYRQLPEFKNRNQAQQRKETVVSNRNKASVYQKKLQSRVLQGQLNLPHSACL